MKSAVVTGARGFIGRHVARCLNHRGYRVVGVGRSSWQEHKHWGVSDFVEIDLSEDSLGKIGVQPDLLIHCTGGNEVRHSFVDPRADFRSTVETASMVLDYLRTNAPACKVAFTSSAAVYGKVETLPITEDAPLRPISPYGRHKVFVEELAEYYGRDFAIATAAVRLFSVYGAGLEKQLFWDACKKLSGGARSFDGTGEERRDWLHVEDAAKLLIAAAENATPDCLIVNGGSGASTSVKRALQVLASAFGDEPIVFTGAERRGDPSVYEADIRRACALGWKPERRLEEGLAEYTDHFKRAHP